MGETKDTTGSDRATRSELAASGYILPESHFDADGNPLNTIEESAANEQRLADEARKRGGPATITGKAGAGAPSNKSRTPATENKSVADDDGDELAGVAFASSAARDAAVASNLTAADFKRKRKSSDAGYTVDDVNRIAGSE